MKVEKKDDVVVMHIEKFDVEFNLEGTIQMGFDLRRMNKKSVVITDNDEVTIILKYQDQDVTELVEGAFRDMIEKVY